jgi:hypothetical protein
MTATDILPIAAGTCIVRDTAANRGRTRTVVPGADTTSAFPPDAGARPRIPQGR